MLFFKINFILREKKKTLRKNLKKALLGFSVSSMQKTISYPKLRKENIIDKHGLPDPYQWIENKLDSEEVTKWISEQNAIVDNYINVPIREQIQKRLSKLYNYEKYSAPFKYGNKYFYYHNSGLQNQSVLYMQDTLDSKPEVLIDPNTLATDGTASLDHPQFAKYRTASSRRNTESCSLSPPENGHVRYSSPGVRRSRLTHRRRKTEQCHRDPRTHSEATLSSG